MLLRILTVACAVLVIMGGWFILQALTRRVCRTDPDADVFEQLSKGCGSCESEGLCPEKQKCRSTRENTRNFV